MNILVTGATGTVGSQLANQLYQAGHYVRALTRNSAKANFPAGVEVVVGDLTEPETIKHALQGIEALHLITFGGDDYAPLQTGPEIMAMAAQAGVKRVTVLRGGLEGALEEAVKASQIAWTFLQPVEFMGNMLEWAERIRTEGFVREPFPDRKTAIVHEADIAAVAAAALTEGGHNSREYIITGPEVLTPLKITSIIAAAINRPIEFIELTPEEAQDIWKAVGHSQELIDFLLWVYGNPPEEGYTVVSTVEEVTGCPARTFAQWAAENAHHFQVNVPQQA